MKFLFPFWRKREKPVEKSNHLPRYDAINFSKKVRCYLDNLKHSQKKAIPVVYRSTNVLSVYRTTFTDWLLSLKRLEEISKMEDTLYVWMSEDRLLHQKKVLLDDYLGDMTTDKQGVATLIEMIGLSLNCIDQLSNGSTPTYLERLQYDLVTLLKAIFDKE